MGVSCRREVACNVWEVGALIADATAVSDIVYKLTDEVFVWVKS